MRRKLAVSLAFVCLLAFACKRQHGSSEGGGEAGSPSGAVARVNGVALPREPFDRGFARVIERNEKSGQPMSPQARERLKDQLVFRMVETEVIRQTAEKLGVTLSKEEETERWESFKKRYGTDEGLQAFVDKIGTTVEDLRTGIAANSLRDKLLAKAAEGASVTPEEVKAYYETNRERFVDPREQPPRQRTFDEMKEQIERTLLVQKQRETARSNVAKWKNEAKIEIFVKGDQKIIAGDRPTSPAAPAPDATPPSAGS